MTFILFLIILGVLVFVHEFGHFLAAKKAGVKVEELGFGYPPRAKILGRKWGTLFSLNWIPFGGFVKIFGEDYEEGEKQVPLQTEGENKIVSIEETSYSAEITSQGVVQSFESENLEIEIPDSKTDKNFTQISKKWQATILAAGVVFNIIFAWLLFSLGFMIGLPTSVENDYGMVVKNPALTITNIAPGSPAAEVGLKSGDKIKVLSNSETILENPELDAVSNFINKTSGKVLVQIDRGGKILDFKVLPKDGIAENPSNSSGQARKAIGISMDMIGTLRLPAHKAVYEGGKVTLELSQQTVSGIASLIKDAVRGKADMSQVAGPVGIIGLVGDASRLGFTYLITFTALISINLAIINLVPFPALDGGRIVLVAIEGITRRKMNSRIIHTLNNVGFFLLIALMLVITYRDILKLF
jgi:regulator of sigma E protease